MIPYYRFFSYRIATPSLIVMLALCLFLSSVSYGTERERKRTALLRPSEMIAALQEDPKSTVRMEFSEFHHLKANTIIAKVSTSVQIQYVAQDYVPEIDDWENTDRRFHVLDNAGRIIQDVYQLFMYGEWVNDERIVYEYEGANQDPSVELWQEWDADADDWLNIEREIYTFNAQGQIVEVLIEEWYDGEWHPYEKNEISYTPAGTFLEILSYLWLENDWEPEYWTRWSYENGLLVEMYEEYWDGDEWTPEFRILYEYDDDGNNILVTTQEYDEYEEEWENQIRFLNSYDAAGRPVESIFQYWDDGWVSFMKTDSEYDARGNLITETRSIWIGGQSYTLSSGQWSPSFQNQYHYSPFDILLMMIAVYWSGEDWMWAYRYLYYGYDPTSVADGEGIPDQFILMQNYPNPFNPSTTIRYSIPERTHVMLQVYNMLGQEVARLVDEELDAGYHQLQFDASQLPSGMYIYRLQAGSFVDSKKLIFLK